MERFGTQGREPRGSMVYVIITVLYLRAFLSVCCFFCVVLSYCDCMSQFLVCSH